MPYYLIICGDHELLFSICITLQCASIRDLAFSANGAQVFTIRIPIEISLLLTTLTFPEHDSEDLPDLYDVIESI